MVGAFVFGPIADRIGRKAVLDLLDLRLRRGQHPLGLGHGCQSC